MGSCKIHYQLRVNSAKDKPGLIFVHGNGAHSRWWDFIAPAFSSEFNLVAIDLSGAGDSGHRDEYSAAIFAQEIMAVMDDAQLNRPILVGHSFGGAMSRIATWLNQEQFSGLVLVDSILSNHKGTRLPIRKPSSRSRYYKSAEEAMLRFRLRPAQKCKNDFILMYIARHSVQMSESGWAFKSDQSLFSKMSTPDSQVTDEKKSSDYPDSISMVKDIKKPVALIYGEQSRFFDSDHIKLARSVISPELLYQISDAHHHVFLDQPLTFIDTLQSVLDQILGNQNLA